MKIIIDNKNKQIMFQGTIKEFEYLEKKGYLKLKGGKNGR